MNASLQYVRALNHMTMKSWREERTVNNSLQEAKILNHKNIQTSLHAAFFSFFFLQHS